MLLGGSSIKSIHHQNKCKLQVTLCLASVSINSPSKQINSPSVQISKRLNNIFKSESRTIIFSNLSQEQEQVPVPIILCLTSLSIASSCNKNQISTAAVDMLSITMIGGFVTKSLQKIIRGSSSKLKHAKCEIRCLGK